MRTVHLRRLALTLFSALAASCAGASTPPSRTLSPLADWPLPGGTTRFDYLSLDPSLHRLSISHMGDGHLVVMDSESGKLIADLDGFLGVTGVLVVPELKKVYASVTGSHEVVVLDASSLKVLARVPSGRFPDGLAYAPGPKRIFVSDESAGQETVIDGSNDRLVARVDLGGEAGNSQYDPVSGRILVTIQSQDQLLELDPTTLAVIAKHSLQSAGGPHGMAMDVEDHMAFVACEDSSKLLAVGLKDFSVLQVLPTGAGPDVLAWDAARKRLYVACESGVVSVFQWSQGKLEKIEDAAVGKNCHSVALDPRGQRLYFPLKNVGGRPVLRVMREESSQ